LDFYASYRTSSCSSSMSGGSHGADNTYKSMHVSIKLSSFSSVKSGQTRTTD